MKAIATLPFTDTVRVPDSTAWSTATDSGHGGVSCTGTTCYDTLSLKDPLGSQIATIQTWTLGIHLETLHFTQSGNNPSLVALDTFHIDSLGLKLWSPSTACARSWAIPWPRPDLSPRT